MNETCSRCHYFQLFEGMNEGYCYGTPPAANPNGFTNAIPKVKASRPVCINFKPLPEGVPTKTKTKVQPDTVGQALKQRRELLKDKYNI